MLKDVIESQLKKLRSISGQLFSSWSLREEKMAIQSLSQILNPSTMARCLVTAICHLSQRQLGVLERMMSKVKRVRKKNKRRVMKMAKEQLIKKARRLKERRLQRE